MASVRPFRALRYATDRVDFASVLAPVYDVVSPEDRDVYWQRDPHNALRLELTRSVEEEADADYRDTAETLEAWLAEGVLRFDDAPAFYVLRQTFSAPDGRELARTGVFVALDVEPYERRIVRPHERTLAGPKADRLKILRATRTNLSSVFMLYEDRDGKLDSLLDEALAASDAIEVTNDAGIHHRLAPLRDEAGVAALQGFLADRPLVIADGHHRYETALNYHAEQEGAGTPDRGHGRILAYLANAFAPGSLLLPIHRLVREVAAPDDGGWAKLAGWSATSVAIPGEDAIPGLLAEHLAPLADRHAFAADDGSGQLRIFSKPGDEELTVRVVHREVLDGVFGLDDDAVRNGAVSFPKSAEQTARDVRNGRGTVALYLNPLAPDDVFRVTEAGETLPQKSTFFFPKLPTGILFRSVDTEFGGGDA